MSLLPLPSDETQSRWGGRNSAQASTKRKTLTSNHQQRRFRGGDFYLDVKQTSDKRRGGRKKLPELTETESPDNPVNRVLRRSALIFQLSVSSGSSSSSSEEEDWFEAVRTENELFGPLIICGL